MTHPKTPHVLDARYMESPEPFVKTMEMLNLLKEGQKMLLQLLREPHPLYQAIKQNGHAYETEPLPDGTFEVLISR